MKNYEPKKSVAVDSSTPLISVVISARDEDDAIGRIISGTREALSRQSHEIIVVNDGSVDSTAEIARSNGAIVVSHEGNHGKGVAMKTGAETSRGDIIVFLDADGAHDPHDIPSVIAPILENKADLVIGSRALPESKVLFFSPMRKLTNELASLSISGIVFFLLPLATLFRCPMKYIKITDCTSGFRAIRREGWHKLRLISDRFEIETEMIYEAVKNRLAIKDIPISCNWDSRRSRLSIFRDGSKTVKLLARKLIGEIGGR